MGDANNAVRTQITLEIMFCLLSRIILYKPPKIQPWRLLVNFSTHNSLEITEVKETI